MWRQFLAQPVFEVGGRRYQWVDVVLDAMARGDWAAFERTLIEGLACEACADAEESWPARAEIDRAGDTFRYDRDLLAAADLTAWLDAGGLSVDDWFGFLARLVLRRTWSGQLSAIVERHPPSMDRLVEAAPIDGLCSGALVRRAESMAGRAAVADQSVASADESSAGVALSDFPGSLTGGWFPGWEREDLRARAERAGQNAARFDHIARQALTRTALETSLREHAFDWLRVEIESLACRDEHAAREAQSCVREDGMSLADVAAVIGTSLEIGSFLLDEVAADRRDMLLSARPGELLGPLAGDGRWEVVRVVAKRLAALDDPDVLRRAEAAVAAALTGAASALVRWQIPR